MCSVSSRSGARAGTPAQYLYIVKLVLLGFKPDEDIFMHRRPRSVPAVSKVGATVIRGEIKPPELGLFRKLDSKMGGYNRNWVGFDSNYSRFDINRSRFHSNSGRIHSESKKVYVRYFRTLRKLPPRESPFI